MTTEHNFIKLSREYLAWAHGPAAESGEPAAQEIIDRVSAGQSKTLALELTPAVRAELRSCAALWADRQGVDPSAVPIGYSRTARRILRETRNEH